MDEAAIDVVLQSILDVELPDARLVASSKLAGGNFTSVRRVEVELADLEGRSMAVRVQPRLAAERLVLALPRLRQLGVPVPELIGARGLDDGRSVVLLGYLPGESVAPDLPIDERSRELASVLAAVHEVDPSALELEPFPLLPSEHLRTWISPHPLADDALKALSEAASHLVGAPEVLVHGDYWTGNILWQDGAIVGLLDWDNVARGPRAADVAKCRLDLALRFGSQAADAFLVAYEASAQVRVSHLAYWDVRIGIEGMPDPGQWWLPTYRLLGVSDLTPGSVRRNYDDYVSRALDRLRA